MHIQRETINRGALAPMARTRRPRDYLYLLVSLGMKPAGYASTVSWCLFKYFVCLVGLTDLWFP